MIGSSTSTSGKGVYGYVTASTGLSYGVHGLTSSSGGRGVYGQALTGSGNAYGVYGTTLSSTGHGVYGQTEISQGISYGVRGKNVSSDGYGVYGEATATTGTSYGVYGTNASSAGYGVYGAATATQGNNYGVYGVSASSGGFGVYGEASATSGTNYGIYGKSAHFYGYAGYFDGNVEVDGEVDVVGTLFCQDATTTGTGVIGSATSTTGYTYGVKGECASTDGQAVFGYASATTGDAGGVHGKSISTGGYGVYGEATATTGSCYGVRGGCGSTDGYGVYGSAYATTGSTIGVYGKCESPSGVAVRGVAVATSGQTRGVFGSCVSTQGRGVYGHAYATSGGATGVYGATDSDNGYGGYFEGRLHARESINDLAQPQNHVVHFYNSSSGTNPDVLALAVGTSGDPGSGVNFVTFYKDYDVAVGAIEGDGAGGVTYKSGSGDFAEYLPKLNPSEVMEAGDVVGVYSGQVSKRTGGAAQSMVVSTRPIVLGNDPGDDHAEGYARVAFIGQVEVSVSGEVDSGDLLVPSGLEDGTAIAVSRDEITAEQFRYVVGQAWESSRDVGVKKIRASVGLQNHDPTVVRMAETIHHLRNELADVKARLEGLEGQITRR